LNGINDDKRKGQAGVGILPVLNGILQ